MTEAVFENSFGILANFGHLPGKNRPAQPVAAGIPACRRAGASSPAAKNSVPQVAPEPDAARNLHQIQNHDLSKKHSHEDPSPAIDKWKRGLG